MVGTGTGLNGVTRESITGYRGARFEVMAYGGRIEFVPVRPMKQVRGFLKGMDTSVPRGKGRV